MIYNKYPLDACMMTYVPSLADGIYLVFCHTIPQNEPTQLADLGMEYTELHVVQSK